MLFRCIIKLKLKYFSMGKTYNNKWYLIKNNKFNSHFKVGNDYNFFAIKKNKFLVDILNPISEDEGINNKI